jgi:hypothetical protein
MIRRVIPSFLHSLVLFRLVKVLAKRIELLVH